MNRIVLLLLALSVVFYLFPTVFQPIFSQNFSSVGLFENGSSTSPIHLGRGFVKINPDGSWFTTSYPGSTVIVNGDTTETGMNNLIVLYHFDQNDALISYYLFQCNSSFDVADALTVKNDKIWVRLTAVRPGFEAPRIFMIEPLTGEIKRQFNAEDLILEMSSDGTVHNEILSNSRNGLIFDFSRNKLFNDEWGNLFFALGSGVDNLPSDEYLVINDSIFDFGLENEEIIGSVFQLDSAWNLINRIHFANGNKGISLHFTGLSRGINGEMVLSGYYGSQLNEAEVIYLHSESGIDSIASVKKGEGVISFKVNDQFELGWVKDIKQAQLRFASDIDDLGNYYLTGFVGGNDVDFNPLGESVIGGPGNTNLQGYIAAYDPGGELLWVRTQLPAVGEIKVNGNRDLIATGIVRGGQNLNIAFPEVNLRKFGGQDAFVAVFDSLGKLVFAEVFGSEGDDHGASIAVGPDSDFLISGSAHSVIEFSSGYQQIGLDGVPFLQYVLKSKSMLCNHLAIKPEIDPVSCNSNGRMLIPVPDSLEGFISVDWPTPLESDSFSVDVEYGGFYNITLSDTLGCSESYIYYVPGPIQNSDKESAIGIFADEFRSGFNTNINLTLFNESCNLENGTLVLLPDPVLNYLSASITPDLVAADRLEWDRENVLFQSFNNTIEIKVNTPANTPFGDTVLLRAFWLYEEDGLTISTDTQTVEFLVVNAYDPNDKQVNPQGYGLTRRIGNNEQMLYRVRFQNTGNAEAINVSISDFLPNELDPLSLRVLDHSHPMVVQLVEDQHLRFIFDNIYLPDSSSSFDESIGYVVFAVDQRPELPEGTTINNEALIFFDFNEPIITNEVSNLIDLCEHFQAEIQISEELLIAIPPAESSIQWIDCLNDRYIPGADSQTFLPDTSGTYGYVATDGYCLVASDCLEYIVSSSSDPIKEKVSVVLHPNPVREELTVTSNIPMIWQQIEVLDGSGRMIFSEKLNSANLYEQPYKLKTNGWENGFFVLRLLGDDGFYQHRVFVKVN